MHDIKLTIWIFLVGADYVNSENYSTYHIYSQRGSTYTHPSGVYVVPVTWNSWNSASSLFTDFTMKNCSDWAMNMHDYCYVKHWINIHIVSKVRVNLYFLQTGFYFRLPQQRGIPGRFSSPVKRLSAFLIITGQHQFTITTHCPIVL